MPCLSIAARRLRGNASSIYRSAPLFTDDDDRTHYCTTLNNNFSSPVFIKKREYHSTSRNEILPFIAVGLLGATAVYTYRTFEQMDKDWDEYYDDLEKYKYATGIDPEKGSNAAADTKSNPTSSHDLSSHFTGGTLAIDLGTSTLKLSHRQSSHNNNKKVNPTVSVDREGYRSTPALVWIGESNDEDTIVGRLAQARSFDKKGGCIIHPRLAMEKNDNNELASKATRDIIYNAAGNALDQILGGAGRGGGNSNEPLFVLDSTMVTKGSYNVRPICLYPNHHDENQYLACYRDAINKMTSPAGIASFVAEPIAAVTGAEHYNLLPPKDANASSVLVIDVGGLSTSISLVSGDKEVLHSSSFPFGGDTFIDALVSHLIRNFDGFQHEAAHGGLSRDGNSPLSSKPTLSDASALQRLYEASTHAIHELSNKTRCDINIPYLTMDLETRQPKHLEFGMARQVVESEVQSFVSNSLVPHLESGDITLSPSFPPPTTLSALFSSAIMSTLEKTALTPFNLRAILLVGGGARIPLVRTSLKTATAVLAGDAYANNTDGKRLVMLEGELSEEINVIGAALWGSEGN
eukprot:scaffold43185_cov197-Skeletonema_marinoi.AAC.1